MKTSVVKTGHFWLSLLLTASGCIVGCGGQPSEVRFDQRLLTNAVLSELPTDGSPVDGEFQLPDLCNLNIQYVLLAADHHMPYKVREIQVTALSLVLERVTLTATAGTLNSFETVTLTLVIGGQVFALGPGIPTDDGTTVDLIPENPPDLLTTLAEDLDNPDCPTGSLVVTGQAPTEPLEFSLDAHWFYSFFYTERVY